jgi:hypothetical protein
MRRGVRGIAFVAAVLAHVAFVALLMTSAPRRVSEQADVSPMVVVFIEPEARRAVSEPLRSSAPTLFVPPSPVNIEPPRLESSAPTMVTPDIPPETAPPQPSIDWQQETRTAAARLAESVEEERRRKGKYAPDPRFARPAPRAQFGWDESKTHRIEALPEGGTLIHLNDRCFIVLSGFLLPMCKLGKIPARGDLFEHMGDAPASDELP